MIEAHDLVKRYGATVAVSDLSFSIRPGMVTGFLGPNGAGKTTTMRMILGLDAPTQGSVTVGGRSYRDLPANMRARWAPSSTPRRCPAAAGPATTCYAWPRVTASTGSGP